MEQRIHINRRGAGSIEFEAAELIIPLRQGEETSFEIIIKNHGAPTHVHLSASEELRSQLIFVRDNPYVKGEERVPVLAKFPRGSKAQLRGEVSVTTGYGEKRSSFSVSIGGMKEEEEGERGTAAAAEVEVERAKTEMKGEEKPEVKKKTPLIVQLVSAALILVFLLLAFIYKSEETLTFIFSLLASALVMFLILYSWRRVVSAPQT